MEAKLTQGYFKKPFRVLQVTSKSKKLKQAVSFLRAVEFWPTFDYQIDITGHILGKVAELYLKSRQKFLKTSQHSNQ